MNVRRDEQGCLEVVNGKYSGRAGRKEVALMAAAFGERRSERNHARVREREVVDKTHAGTSSLDSP